MIAAEKMYEKMLLEEQQAKDHNPIYSKKSIFWFTFFFSALIGGLLLFIDLKNNGKRKEANYVVLFSIGYLFLQVIILGSFQQASPVFNYLINCIAALILTGFFLNKYLPLHQKYPKKKIWKLLIIILSVCAVMLLLNIFISTKHR